MPTRSQLDLRTQVGQLLIMGFDGVELSAKLRTTLQSLQPSGVILFTRNIKDPRQTRELLRECQRSVAHPMFLCVDMEGGTVDRLRDVIAPAPPVADIAATGNRELFRRHGRVIGEECSGLGFNTDFAPVLDLRLPPSEKVLTSRTVSADPKRTVLYAREFLRGLRDAHVLGCGKHFPGLGEASLDTHRELPTIDKSRKRLWDEDLYPYRQLHRRLPFIMVAHAAYSTVANGATPASLSKLWINDILRKKIGYRGLIVSDDLEMGGVQAALPLREVAAASIRAGSDMFLVCHKEKSVWECYESVYEAAQQDRRLAQRVADSARSILAFKKKCPELKHPRPAPTTQTIDKLRRALWELGEEARLARVAAEECSRP